MGTYYAVQGGSRILNTSRVDQSGSDNVAVTGWMKNAPFILAVNINSGDKETAAAAYKLRWRISGGTFADVAATGAIKFGDTTALVNGTALTSTNRRCSQQGGDTYQNGWEVEGTANSGSIDLVDEYESELQFSLSAADATDGATYQFELWDVTQNVSKGTCGVTLTLANVPTVTTQSCSSISQTSATGNGNVTNTGGLTISRRGFCYMEGTSGDPTTANSVAYDDGTFGTGPYTKGLTGLTPETNYRVRAYAVNSLGTSYGTTVQLTTLAYAATVTLDSPTNTGTVYDKTPELKFTGTISNSNDLTYQLQVDTVNTFNNVLTQSNVVYDSYLDGGYGTAISGTSGYYAGRGQSFYNGLGKRFLVSAIFNLQKVGNPTGTIYCKLYAHSGTFGTSDSIPTGSALVSKGIDVGTLSTSYSDVPFTFDTPYELTSSTAYFIVLEYTTGNAPTDVVNVMADNTSPTHAGSSATLLVSTWSNQVSIDNYFRVIVNEYGPKIDDTSDVETTAFTRTGDSDPFTSGQQVTYTVQAAGGSVSESYIGSEDGATGLVSNIAVGSYSRAGQCFNGLSGTLVGCSFSVKKAVNTTTRDIYCKLYAISGVFGSTGIPTGNALATSNPVSTDDISTNLGTISFTFSDNYVLDGYTNYIITIADGYDTGASGNYIFAGYDSTTPTHEGNGAVYANVSSTWVQTTNDYSFSVTVEYAGDILDYTTYYWRVRAKDPAGSNTYGDWSSIYSFTVDSYPPSVVLNTPNDTGTVDSTTPTLEFTGTDPESEAVEYQIQIDSVNTFDSQGTTPVIFESYSFSNSDLGFNWLDNPMSAWKCIGQAFTGDGSTLDSVRVWVSLQSAGAGASIQYVCKLYAATGTLGTDAKPTGTAIATAYATYHITSTSAVPIDFIFTSPPTLSNGTNYVIVFINPSQVIPMYLYGDMTSPTHYGNYCYSTDDSSYTGSSNRDLCFELYEGTGTYPLIDAVSETDSGFSNTTDSEDTHPFDSGDKADYDVQAGDALTDTQTYYWKVRAKDPAGSNSYGDWATTRSFTVNTSGGGGDLSKSVYDISNVSEYIEIFIEELFLEVGDNVNVSEEITKDLSVEANIWDNAQETEWIDYDVETPQEEDLNRSDIVSNVNVTEEITIQNDLEINLYDSVNTLEDISKDLSIEINLWDNTNTTEDITKNAYLEVNKYDSSETSEYLNFEYDAFIIEVNDNIQETEYINWIVNDAEDYTVNVFDTSNVLEEITLNEEINSEVNDNVQETEYIQTNLDLEINLWDNVNVSEQITKNAYLEINVNDIAQETENISTLYDAFIVEVNDNVQETEYINWVVTAAEDYEVNVFDNITTEDNLDIKLSDVQINLWDDVQETEYINWVVNAAEDYTVDVFDSINISEDIILETGIELEIIDNVQETEDITVENTDIYLFVYDDISTTELVQGVYGLSVEKYATSSSGQWIDMYKAYANDDDSAYAVPATNTNLIMTLEGFGFNLPGDAQVDSVVIEIKWKNQPNTVGGQLRAKTFVSDVQKGSTLDYDGGV